MGLRKVGIIAGAFDPIHNGHIRFIEESIEKHNLDKVLILIEEKSRFKRSFADFPRRRKMVELSIKNNPKVEIYPSVTDSYPISSTLPKIKAEIKDAKFYLMVGNDVKDHIRQWPGSSELLDNVEIVVADRSSADGHKLVSSGKVREQIKTGATKVDMDKEALSYCRENNLYR